MDEQSGESNEEEVMGKINEQVSRKWRNWYQNEVDKEIKEVIDSRDKKPRSRSKTSREPQVIMKVANL